MHGLSIWAITATVGFIECVIVDNLTYQPASYIRMPNMVSAMNTTFVLGILVREAVIFTVNQSWF